MAVHQEPRGNNITCRKSQITVGSLPRCPTVPARQPIQTPCSSAPSRRPDKCQCSAPSYFRYTTRTVSAVILQKGTGRPNSSMSRYPDLTSRYLRPRGGAEMVDVAPARRFSGFAELYDTARLSPPIELVDLLTGWSAVAHPDVVDLGAGTGLSTALWTGRARSVIAVEPSADMRERTDRRVAALPDAAAFTVVDATAEDTGLPTACADVVTASQAMHWFDADQIGRAH